MRMPHPSMCPSGVDMTQWVVTRQDSHTHRDRPPPPLQATAGPYIPQALPELM